MYENDKLTGAIVYGLYWAVLLYSYFRLFWKRRPVRQWAAVRDGERGQGLVEYALILVLVAVVVIGILLILGPAIKQLF